MLHIILHERSTYYHPIIIIIIIIIINDHYAEFYKYAPERNHISGEHKLAYILWLRRLVHVMLLLMKKRLLLLHYYFPKYVRNIIIGFFG
jgi:hypothetical protein